MAISAAATPSRPARRSVAHHPPVALPPILDIVRMDRRCRAHAQPQWRRLSRRLQVVVPYRGGWRAALRPYLFRWSNYRFFFFSFA